MALRIIKVAVLFACSFHITNLFAQHLITEFEVEKAKVDNLRGVAFNDSIFLTADLISGGYAQGKISYWVKEDGSKRKVDLSKIGDRAIFAVAQNGNYEYYYYLVEVDKSVAIRALAVNKVSGESQIGKQEITIVGNIYGSFTEGNSLFLLTTVKGSYVLNLVQISGFEIESIKTYNLSFDLGSHDVSHTHLKFEGTAFLPSNSIGQVKITAASDAIWISVDEPKNLNARVEVPKQLYKTSVVKLNRLTPEESYVKTFFTSAEVFFSSTINNGYLFRVYKDSYFHCEIIKISTGQKIIDKALSIKYEFPNTTTYFRNLDYKIEKEITSRPISDLQANFINVDSLGNSEYVVSMGGWGIYKSSTPLIPNFGLVGMLASAFVQAAIRDLSEGEYMFSYGHFNISMDGRLKFTNESNRLIQQVDEYEIANLGKKPFFKGYLAGDEKIYAFYKDERVSNLKVLLFKR